MVVKSSGVAASNREFLDTYLEMGIGHYYTVARLLCDSDSDELSDADRIAIGVEVSALASASLDNLVTWYQALRHWDPRKNAALIVKALDAVHLDEAGRQEVRRHVTDTRTDQFCLTFRIPWSREELRARRLDESNWRYTIDQAKLNIGKVLQDLTPASVSTPRDWVVKQINDSKHRFLISAGGHTSYPTAQLSEESVVISGDQGSQGLGIPTESEALDEVLNLIGNAAIGLFMLVRLLYITAYRQDPRSPAFVLIWQELHPSRGQGA